MSSAAPLILQLSDLHLFAEAEGCQKGVRTAESFGRVLADALAHHPHPDLLLLTGDLVQDESRQGYERLRDLLRGLDMPVAAIPGNHDSPAFLGEVLGAAGVRTGGCLDIGAWRIVLLSSWTAGDAGGFLTAAELGRLETTLAEAPERHALICLHHHPLPMGSQWLDTVGLRNADELLALLGRHANSRALIYGHVHQESDRRHDGLRVLGAPSTCYQFLPNSAAFALDSRGPGYRWLQLHEDGTIGTGVRRVEAAWSLCG